MSKQTNPQLELAFEYVRYTSKNIFLTGKAGTGKTTFLHEIKKDAAKRSVVVAPTGVAAINAGGVTIHSLFQLPFGPLPPDSAQNLNRQRKFSGEKIRLLKSLDLLIIDEISMVRADLLDAIDSVLRRFKDPFQPFGGVQLLMIGDLHQLPPVIKEEEWMLLRDHYTTAYFFGSKALHETDTIQIELTHIFRQSDLTFIELLNRVRDNQIDNAVLAQLNSRFIANFQPDESEGYITLSSHNASANEINTHRLAALKTPSKFFKATVEGDFPPFSYPTGEDLELKIGAQVMFVKNDQSRERLFYNGKIGKITRFEGETIWVKCPADYAEIPVTKVEWNNLKYNLNEASKEVEEETIGRFIQFPLKLAWAITIHKSQGLTFEKAIIDANAAFAHGQVYVALSRCKTFEGMVLSSRIGNSSIRTDTVVKNYSKTASENPPDEQQLLNSKAEFQQQLMLDLFDFSEMRKRFDRVHRLFLEHENTLQPGIIWPLDELFSVCDTLLFTVSKKFQAPLKDYFRETALPEEHAALQERAKKASQYFTEKLKTECLPRLPKLQPQTDNKEAKKRVTEGLESLHLEAYIKIRCFDLLVNEGFTTIAYLREKANAALDFQTKKPVLTVKTPLSDAPSNRTSPETEGEKREILEIASAEIPHPELVERLRAWRTDFAAELEVEAYQILHNKVLYLLSAILPQNLLELEQVKGLGKIKVNQFGTEIVEIIQNYCLEKAIPPESVSLFDAAESLKIEPAKKVSSAKIDTKRLSHDEFLSGKTLAQIAEERGLTVSTIEGHLSHFIGTGELDIAKVLDLNSVAEISAYFENNPEEKSLAAAKEGLGEQYSFGELRMVLAHLGR